MISLLPLQEFISFTSIQGEFCTSALCTIFYVDFLQANLCCCCLEVHLLNMCDLLHMILPLENDKILDGAL
ncbi:hypothetical protein B296_00017081 [Ensete ventricosum]|uniref:Uncharacterized protein n=1 Tax=Ensete ventricosum TaxID=4639 RepID=A0A426XDE8_ENSVE|nr:hypothetical protein B296_00017081 [Ensete ventricosum]